MVCRVETAASAADHSANPYQAVGDMVSLSTSATSATVGTPVSFTGTVTPDHTGHAISLQVLTTRGGWQDVQGHFVARGSRYGFSYAFGQPGTYAARAELRRSGQRGRGVDSTPVTVTVAGDAAASSLPAAS